MCTTDADVFHDDLWRVVTANDDFLVPAERNDVLVEFFTAIFDLTVFELGIGRFKSRKVEEWVWPALMLELIGEIMLAQLAIGLLVSVKLAMLILPLGKVIGNPIFQAQEVYVLDGPWAFTQA